MSTPECYDGTERDLMGFGAGKPPTTPARPINPAFSTRKGKLSPTGWQNTEKGWGVRYKVLGIVIVVGIAVLVLRR